MISVTINFSLNKTVLVFHKHERQMAEEAYAETEKEEEADEV